MTRVAALDCGTNSLRLLVADVEDRRLTDLTRRMEIVRLGEGVDRTGRLSEAGLQRTFRVLDEYAEAIDAADVDAVRLVATSATRDAENQQEFVAGVAARLGVDPEVITGADEAALSFAGATRELLGSSRFPSPYLVVDIGGGSTEFIVGDDSGATAARSVDVGCVRLTERHLHDHPPTPEQIAAAVADIDAGIELAGAAVPLSDARTLIGLAGSVTTVAALALRLPEYDAERIHHAQVSAEQVHEVTERLLGLTPQERAALPAMHPGRADVIGAGALVLDRIMQRGGWQCVVASEHDILDGIAYSMAP